MFDQSQPLGKETGHLAYLHHLPRDNCPSNGAIFRKSRQADRRDYPRVSSRVSGAGWFVLQNSPCLDFGTIVCVLGPLFLSQSRALTGRQCTTVAPLGEKGVHR